MKTVHVAMAITLAGAVASADVLWDNGGIITHPGAGFQGADVSMASAALDIDGVVASAFDWRRADDFAVPDPGWYVDSITIYMFSTGAALDANPWDWVSMTIWDGLPGAGSVVGVSNVMTHEFAGIYRVLNGEGNLLDDQRAIHAVTIDFAGLELPAGDNYWIDLHAWHGPDFSALIPFVMAINPDNPWDPITVPGNHMYLGPGTGGWTNWIDDDTGATAELPFVIRGSVIPAPGSLALMGVGCLTFARRRR